MSIWRSCSDPPTGSGPGQRHLNATPGAQESREDYVGPLQGNPPGESASASASILGPGSEAMRPCLVRVTSARTHVSMPAPGGR